MEILQGYRAWGISPDGTVTSILHTSFITRHYWNSGPNVIEELPCSLTIHIDSGFHSWKSIEHLIKGTGLNFRDPKLYNGGIGWSLRWMKYPTFLQQGARNLFPCYGVVFHGGEVIEGSHGFRSTQASIAYIFDLCDDPVRLRLAASRYNVEIVKTPPEIVNKYIWCEKKIQEELLGDE